MEESADTAIEKPLSSIPKIWSLVLHLWRKTTLNTKLMYLHFLLLLKRTRISSICVGKRSEDAVAMKEDDPEPRNNDPASCSSTATEIKEGSSTFEEKCRHVEGQAAVGMKRPLKMEAASYYIPRMKKHRTNFIGDDAHFICEPEQVVGVADGVGGWAKYGIDAGEYARELMSYAEKAVQASPEGTVDPYRVLEIAHSWTYAKGSSTACILALKDQNIHAVNIGDSGFVVVRDHAIFYHSPVQRKGFNRPYQLGNSCRKKPNSAEVISCGVQPGDIIVLGTDGLFDNLFDHEVIEAIELGSKLKLSAKSLATLIAVFARDTSLKTSCETPFSTASKEAGRIHKGGKPDDITVVVMFIDESDP